MNRPAIYSRPKKPLTIPVRKRGEVAPLEKIESPEIITVDRATECHVTPDDVAERMVEISAPRATISLLNQAPGPASLRGRFWRPGTARAN
ncbi:hypothetical protein [Epibacterium sp. Ofav1-8]|uniref:hypothetical protein n=1 Tax=Epibacterium sp. Ofav1-8 TaxID=2917735 RepID=UPI001EF64FAA|nr:hypothetical protein [Epibacterium sp. Ofav1-8]MCG7625951.1 hypothetical protein [Epibacterium sp. Ofav1-8]